MSAIPELCQSLVRINSVNRYRAKARMSLNAVYDVSEAVASRADASGYGAAPIREAFERMIREAEARDECLVTHPSVIEWVKDLIPYEQAADDEWVRKFP